MSILWGMLQPRSARLGKKYPLYEKRPGSSPGLFFEPIGLNPSIEIGAIFI
jgi:hypothetical protein